MQRSLGVLAVPDTAGFEVSSGPAMAAALATYAPNGFGVVANYAAYIAALVAADVAFWASVNTTGTTNGISPTAVDDAYQFYPVTTATILT